MSAGAAETLSVELDRRRSAGQMLLLSGILLPMQLAPDWLQTLSDLNPLTHTVDATRAPFNGAYGEPELAIGVTVTAIAAVLAVLAGARAFSRAVA